jgi:antitoxin YefM
MFSYSITSAKEAEASFLKIIDQVAETHQVFLINREVGENVALIAESDLTSLVETVYLLRSPLNANRLFSAIEESKTGNIKPQSIEELKEELGFE